MKPFYIILFFFTNHFVAHGQNAFYDAKKLSSWTTLADTTKQKKAAEYYALLLSYKANPRSFGRPYIKEIAEDITNHFGIQIVNTIGSKVFFRRIIDSVSRISLPSLQRQLQAQIDDYNRHIGDSKSFDTITLTFLNWRRHLSQIRDSSEIVQNLKRIDSAIGTHRLPTLIVYQDSISLTGLYVSKSFIDTFVQDSSKVFQAYEASIKERKEDYTRLISVDTSTILQTAFENIKEIMKAIVSDAEKDAKLRSLAEQYLREKIVISSKSQDNFTVDKIEQTEGYVKTSISDQNFPSQSEIIDALAIYISRRFKQEVAYTFIEKFTQYLQQNILARELFPATFSMLNTQDPYIMPRLGSEWKNAVSSDLLQLPEHVVNSSIVKRWIKNETIINYLSDAVLIGKYISKKFSYVDMIRSLKEGNGLNSEADTLKSVHLKQAILVSYILNQEFFDSAKTKYWITPEELFRLNKQQVQILGELLSEKYDTDFKSCFNDKNPLDTVSDYYVRYKSRYTDLLATLKQFENSQVAAYMAAKDGGNLKDAFWDFQRILIDYLLREVKDEKSKSAIRNVQKLFYVYDYISAKNYGAAINTSLNMLDTLLLYKSPSYYLRAFVSDVKLTKIENLSLSLDVDTSDVIKRINRLEELAKTVKIIIDIDDNSRTLTNVTSAYLKLFGTGLPKYIIDSLKDNLFTHDTIVINKDSTGKAVTVNKDSIKKTRTVVIKKDFAVKAILRLMEKNKGQLITLTSGKPELENVFKNLHFYNYKSGDTIKLQQYIALAEQLMLNKPPNLVSSFRKVSGFITDASLAKDSKELSKILETYAQPPLSYKLTRKSIFSIGLSTYLGFWAGSEFAFKPPATASENFKRRNGAAGFTVPIGLNFSWGYIAHQPKSMNLRIRKGGTDNRLFFLNKKGKPSLLTGSSHSVFISFIDVAGPVSFRLGSDAAEGLPQDTRWAQILAPGVHYVLGIKNSPLCVSLGFQVSPQLRSYQNIEGKPFTTGRFQISITYDMPLLNFTRRTPF